MLPTRLALARSFVLANKPDAAVKVLDQAPEQQKSILALIVARNWALLALGNTKGLRPVLNQALKLGRFPDLVLQDAILRMAERDYAGARASAEEVLRRNPEDARSARILADTYAAQGDGANALRRLREIAAVRPEAAPLQHLLGQWYMSSGNLTGARKAFEAAKSADPKFVAADFGLAEIDRRENRADAARQRLLGIATADPHNISALLMLADMDLQAGSVPAARARYRSVIEIDAANVYALNGLAYSLAVEGPDEALPYAQQAAELAPGNAGVQDTLGRVYCRKGMFSTAVVHLKVAYAQDPIPRRQYHLGLCYLKSGDKELGQQTIRAALQQDPNLARTEGSW
jgi:tetratricopeptide (TPR) repeat protein